MQWLRRKAQNRLAKPQIAAASREFAKRHPREHQINLAFDALHGTDTAEEIKLTEAGVSQLDAWLGNAVYRSVWEADFHDLLDALGISFEGFTFVDIGSGKGKAMLMASDYPFERIVGVEYSPILHAIAQRNLAVYRSPAQRCTKLEAHLGNALEYRLPEGPVVCVLFNPLETAAMRQFMRQVEHQVSPRSLPVYVIYFNARHIGEVGDAFDGLKKLRILQKTTKRIIFGNSAAGSHATRRPHGP